MDKRQDKAADRARGFLTSLARDVRGNVIMIMTAALIPLAGMVGGGLDISRMYILKTRLQHACDAGALAGRRAMGGGTWSYDDYYPRTQANTFFDANFETGSFGSSGLNRSFSENAGKVTGTASAVLPMTLMRIFGKTTETLSVTCDAEMRLPNTDVMFVLDTTGSMASQQPGDTVSKISALKTAVKCFYEIVARLDTDANCTTGTPSGGTGSEVQIRFGFVPYATNVNVGKLLSPDWFAGTWKYQTRKANYTTNGNSTSFSNWTYDSLPVNVGLLKNGNTWNDQFKWPIGSGGSDRTITWDGCVEERQTVSQSSYTPVPSGAKDLDIDSVPDPSDDTTKWGMVLPNLIYTRSDSRGNWTLDPVTTTSNMRSDDYYACPVESRLLQQWPDASAFDDYVDQLTPEGNTYHDIGLIWGARLISPTGLFASTNALTPRGGEIERHLIFMTDGDACTNADNYTAYGVNWYDRRTIGSSTVPSFVQNCTSGAPLTDQVNARTEALCTIIKNKNITLWVIAFGNLATSTETRLKNCASSGRYFKATNAAALQQTFKTIADQISMLRLTN